MKRIKLEGGYITIIDERPSYGDYYYNEGYHTLGICFMRAYGKNYTDKQFKIIASDFIDGLPNE